MKMTFSAPAPLLAIAALLATSNLAAAQLLVPISQDRRVSGALNADDFVTFLADSDSDSATQFGAFISTASAAIDDPGARGNAGASQTTEVTGDSFFGIGSGFSDTEAIQSPWLIQASGYCLAELEFQVTEKVHFELTGRVTAFDHGTTTVDLLNSAGESFAGSASLGEGDVTVDDVGILLPGTYTARYRVNAGTESNSFGFDFAFGDFDVALHLKPIASNYCSTSPNSVGAGAELALGSSTSLAANDFQVEANGALPGGFGLVFYGGNQVQVPFGDGLRCVGGQTHRVQPPVAADGTGFVSKAISFNVGPAASGPGQILADSTWNFQLWYRDPMGPGGSGFNTSDGLSVIFCD